jgi:hypothetical protein
VPKQRFCSSPNGATVGDRQPQKESCVRTLFILEPGIFQGAPEFLSAHFMWADMFRRWALSVGAEFALAGNPTICELWLSYAGATDGKVEVFSIEPLRVLSQHEYNRASYSRSLYTGEGGASISLQIAHICSLYRPEIAVMTSQSLHIRKGLADLPIISIEQAPLPRLGHAVRTMFDPCGHQTGSILETHAEQIRNLHLTPSQSTEALWLRTRLKHHAACSHPEAGAAQEALRELSGGNRVALLATQPTDWVTYEGAYRPVEIDSLLYLWADQLPEGWIGIPTYHPGQRLGQTIERELARSHSKLRILPPALSQGLTEALLIAADGLVTISSTSAMTALLFGKSTVVVGQSPFNAWCADLPWLIADNPGLPDDLAVRLLVFLTNRIIECNSDLAADTSLLSAFVANVLIGPGPAWLFDTAGWSVEHALRLFAMEAAKAPA